MLIRTQTQTFPCRPSPQTSGLSGTHVKGKSSPSHSIVIVQQSDYEQVRQPVVS
jgi:hypothetical protein